MNDGLWDNEFVDEGVKFGKGEQVMLLMVLTCLRET